MLNIIVEGLVTPNEAGEPLNDAQKEARRRLFKQGSLRQVGDLLSQVFRQITLKGDDRFLDGHPTAEHRGAIEKAITRLVSHPVWTASYNSDAKMAAVKLALEKNQGIQEAFETVALKLSYLILGDQDAEYKAQWLKG